MTTFQQRALTAVIFAAVMLVGLLWNEISFFALFFIISLGCLWEFVGMMLKEDKLRRWIGMGIGGFYLSYLYIANIKSLIGGYYLNGMDSSIEKIDLSNVLFISTLILLIAELFKSSISPFQNVSNILLGIFYTILPLSGSTREMFTSKVVTGILFLTWANDTFAYLIGSKIGKTPLLPRISPKKTWEGTIGGALMCMLTGVVISYFFKELTLINWMVVGAIVATFGTLGDLIESMLKRSVGVKDSGSFMPGHGGFLDRFDAFIFAVPFVYLYLIVLK